MGPTDGNVGKSVGHVMMVSSSNTSTEKDALTTTQEFAERFGGVFSPTQVLMMRLIVIKYAESLSDSVSWS